ncbi:hypothetical protein [Cryptosporangium minutisporangium]|uniref:Uncharacterized protein n=1 Tax=Cryptosporangium minutisporangium TaxID=113569 RepID=A0ABP6SX18_9ACTN
MTHATGARPLGPTVGVRARRAVARLAMALCTALIAAGGLGAVAVPAVATALGAPGWGTPGPSTSGLGAAGSGSGSGFVVGATPATVRAATHASARGTASRARPQRQQENSKPAFTTAQRIHADVLPAGTTVGRIGLAEPLLPAGRTLTDAPSRAPPAPAGLPDTRAPPASGRS